MFDTGRPNRTLEEGATYLASPTGPRLGDAFGALLLECWERGTTPGAVLELIERDDGYMSAGDAARYFAEADAWGPLDRWACAHTRGRVLDVGSGAGRHALYLQQAGHDVVALDVSPLAGEVCRRRGIRDVFTGTAGELAETGVEPFDTFLLLGNNLGLLQSAERTPALLAALAALARPDAVLLGQSRDQYRTDRAIHEQYHQRNRALGRMAGQVRIRVRHQDIATDWFDYLFTSLEELRSLLAGTAWRLEHHEVDGANYLAVLRCAGRSSPRWR